MSVVADLSVPSAQFALRDTFETVPHLSVEFERVVTHSQEWIMPFLWVRGEGLDEFDDVVREDSTVQDATLSSQFDGDGSDAVLYVMHWSQDVKLMINTIFDRKGTLVQALGSHDGWQLKVRFETHTSLSALQEYFQQQDVEFRVERVYTPSKPRQPEFNVTPAQRKALVAALEHGYFAIPRETTVSEIAEDLDISTNALSERLRRGMENLVQTTLRIQDS